MPRLVAVKFVQRAFPPPHLQHAAMQLIAVVTERSALDRLPISVHQNFVGEALGVILHHSRNMAPPICTLTGDKDNPNQGKHGVL